MEMTEETLSKASMWGILDTFPKIWHDLPLKELLILEEELRSILKKTQDKVGGNR